MKGLISLYLWTVGLLYFGILCILCILLSFFFSPQTLDPWIKKSLRFLFTLLHTKVLVEGADNIDSEKTVLFMANHVSIFDVPLLEAYIPIFVRGVEAQRQFRWPLYGWAIRRMGNIPIDRKNIHASIRSIRKTEKRIQQGCSMVILPEGHRTLDGNLRPFKKLPFFLAKQAEIDIIPIGISGLFTLKPKGSWLIHPTTIKIKFGNRVSSRTVKGLSIPELQDLMRKKIQNLIEWF